MTEARKKKLKKVIGIHQELAAEAEAEGNKLAVIFHESRVDDLKSKLGRVSAR